MKAIFLFSAAAMVLLAGACTKAVEAPYDTGVCWHAVPQKDGSLKYNKLATGVPNMETCAATLEGMRLRFNRMGMTRSELMGAYQGNFLFIQKEGVLVGRTLSSARYVALVRTGDGRLAIPGAMRQTPQ